MASDSFNQFCLLFKKNWLLQKRKKILTVFEVVTPFVFFILLIVVRKILSSEFVSKPTTEPAFEITTKFDYLHLKPPKPFTKWVLAFSPNNSQVESIMETVSASLNIDFIEEYGFNSEDDLVKNFTSFNEVLGAVVFLESSFIKDDWAQNIKYKIRLRGEKFEGWKNTSLKPTFRSGWLTHLIMPRTTINGPRQGNKTKGGDIPGYFQEGFLPIQQAVDSAIIKNLGGNSSLIRSFLQKFPFPPYLSDKFIFILQTQFPFFVMLSFCVLVPTICSEITYEKEKKLKEVMKLMGLKAWVNWVAWFVKYSIIMLFITLIMTVVFHTKFGGSTIITYTCPTITFAFLFLYSLNIIVYCCFMSTLFNKATAAASASTLVFLLTYFPHFHYFYTYVLMSNVEKMLLCFIINLSLCQGCRTIAKFEEIGVGVQWSTLGSGPNLGESFSMAHVFIMQFIYLIVFGILTWYIEAVRPGEYGVPQKWNFIFTKKYWKKSSPLTSSNKETEGLMWDEKVDYKEKSSFFQEFSEGARIGIKIRNLTKVFDKSNVKSVDDLNMDIKEGDITVLLGHNGAGKTTTISMLTGLFPPTSGSATINSLNIINDMKLIRKSLGLCPQFNILFDKLTVEEHLDFFSKLKGCPKENVPSEIDHMLDMLFLKDKKYTRSENLSGGMQRKLSVGIALIAGSKFVILDEPSSGLDPEARRELWALLKSQKEGRTIILTTHYMDEADFLADRIAIMGSGRLQCYGSSMFLKRKYGVGYSLRIVMTEPSKYKDLDKFVTKTIPGATLNNTSGLEVNFTLPKNSSREFSKLFNSFETDGTNYGVKSFGVSVTTIEEVFFKIEDLGKEQVAELNEQLRITFNSEGEKLEMENKPKTKEKKTSAITQQFYAVFVKKILNFIRNKKISASQLFIPIIFGYIAIILSSLPIRQDKILSLPLSIDAYPNPVTVYSLSDDYNPTSSRLSCLRRVLNNYKGSKIFLDPKNESFPNITTFLIEKAKHDFLNLRNNYQLGALVSNDYFVGLYNDESYHSIAMSLSMVNNAWLKCLTENSSINYKIETMNHPLPYAPSNQGKFQTKQTLNVGFLLADLLMFGMAFLTTAFSIALVQESINGAKISQLFSGLHVYIYWIGAFLFDYLVYLVISLILVAVLAASTLEGFSEPILLKMLTFLFIMYGWAIIPLVYLISLLFSKPSSAYVWILVGNYLTGTASSLIILILRNPIVNYSEIAEKLEWVFYGILTNFCLEKGIQDTYMNYQNTKICSEMDKKLNLKFMCALGGFFSQKIPCCLENCGDFCMYHTESYFAWEYPGIGRPLIFLFIQGIVFFLFLFLYESNLFNRLKNLQSKKNLKKIIDTEEDDDVRKEREEVMKLQLEESNKNVMFVKELFKVYPGKFHAVNNLSLKLEKGEVFGLLGVNGAGKTSTFKMLTGIETITSGSIFINGVNVKKNLAVARKFIGYCPQFNALVDQMTTKENLVLHARLRGIDSRQIKALTDGLIEKFFLHQYKDKLAGVLSGGNKRKLGIAIAVLGDPMLVFLDEPTAGMDPVSKRKIWTCISKLKEAGSTVVITSHSMEECEALCTRMAIMVNGQFKCLGSSQHLKNKFGSDFSIVFKISPAKNNATLLRPFMDTNYPEAVLEYENEEQIAYRLDKNLPNASMSKIFESIEKNKDKLDLRDYTVSQTTLEQVFINFAKTQLNLQSDSFESKLKNIFFCCF